MMKNDYYGILSVKKILIKQGNIVFAMLGMIFFFAASITIANQDTGSFNRKVYYIYLILFLVSTILSSVLLTVNKNINIVKQELPVLLFFGVLLGLFSLRTKQFFLSYQFGGFRYSVLLVSFVCLGLFVYNTLWLSKNSKIRDNAIMMIGSNFALIALLLIALVLCCTMFPIQPRWDAATTTHALVREIPPNNVFNFYSTALIEHTAQLYGSINAMLSFIVGDVFLAMQITHAFLYLLSICSVYLIVKLINPNINQYVAVLATSIWTFSPFVLGIIGDYSYDQWVIYLFPMVICAYLYKKWFYFLFFVILAAYTKETFILGIAGFSLYMLLSEIFVEKKKIAELIQDKKWQMLIFIGVMWVILYGVLVSKITPSVCYTLFDKGIAKQNIKIFYILNYNWLITGLALAFLGISIKKSTKTRDIMAALFVADIFTMIFYVVFSTVTLSRYMDAHLGAMYLIVIIGITYHGMGLINKILLLLIPCILLISNYKVIDPLSYLAFESHDYGNGKLISTSQPLGDGLVYNSTYIKFDRALNMALDGCKDSKIFFPKYNETSIYNFEGKYSDRYLAYETVSNWDLKNKRRLLFADDDSEQFVVYSVFTAEELLAEIGDEYGYFYSVPCVGGNILDELIERGCVEDLEKFTSGPFTVTRARVKGQSTK